MKLCVLLTPLVYISGCSMSHRGNPYIVFRESSQEQGAHTPGPGWRDIMKKLRRIGGEGTLEIIQHKPHILQIQKLGL